MTEPPQWLRAPAAPVDDRARFAARAHQRQLTKPPGALGALETAAEELAALQGRQWPQLDSVHISVFAADHGVAADGVSAFPREVTGQMVRNFANGGAAISVLAQELGASLEIIDLGVCGEPTPLPGVRRERLGHGTANLRLTAAMTQQQVHGALTAGRDAIKRARLAGAELFIGGEMGIGNTTAATATACALLHAPPDDLAGPGTGLDPVGVRRKVVVIEEALALHGSHIARPEEALRRLSGFEIAALTGAFIAAAQAGLVCLVDGYIAGVAALAAVRIQPSVRPWLLFAHESAEPGHRRVLQALSAQPLLALGMRLGEGSGAAVALATLRLACTLHRKMATFTQAQISAGQPCRA